MRINPSDAETYLELADNYKRATGVSLYEARDVIRWAIDNGHLTSDINDIARYHQERLSASLQADTKLDRQGRKVRKRHCVEIRETAEDGRMVQRNLWCDVDDGPTETLRLSITQREGRIAADVHKLRCDVEYINAERLIPGGLPPIQLRLDFSGGNP